MTEEASALLAKTLQARIKARENRGLLLLILKLLLYPLLFPALIEVFYTGSMTQYIDFHPRPHDLKLGLLGSVLVIFYLDVLTVGNWRSLRGARVDLFSDLSRRDMAERLLLIDPVTGTFARRYLEEIVPREMARADQQETTLSFVKISIERFDTIDLIKGFQEGEHVLRETAQLLKRIFSPTGIIIRHGTADFLVILPETTRHGAITAVRRLLAKAEHLNRRKAFQDFVLQLSIGVADYTKGHDVRNSLAALDTRVRIYYDVESTGA